MGLRTQFAVKNALPGPDQNIYVFIATYDDIAINTDSRKDNMDHRLVPAGKTIVKPIEVDSSDDGAFYLALTFMQSNSPGTGIFSVIYVGPEVNDPKPSVSLIREIRIPEGFRTTLSVSANGFSMYSEPPTDDNV